MDHGVYNRLTGCIYCNVSSFSELESMHEPTPNCYTLTLTSTFDLSTPKPITSTCLGLG